MKKLLTLLLSVMLIVSALPVATLPVAAAADENIALGKPVTANVDRGDGYIPGSIVDGNINSAWAGPAGAVGAALTIDLEGEYIITEVVLYNRTDVKDEHYRRNVNVEFSNTPDFSVKESVVAMRGGVGEEAPFGEPVKVKAPSAKPYRYVRILKTLNTTFVLNEAEVYGYQYDPNALQIGKDVTGTKLEGPVTLLSYLDLIELENPLENIFGINSVMTRAEATDAVVKAFAGNVNFTGWLPFSDVTAETAYRDAIMTAYHMGYITGDEGAAFRPNEYTTVAEMLAMVLRAMNYQDVAENIYDHSLAKIIGRAEDLGLLKNTGLKDYTAFVTRGQMAQIFYNAMLAPGFNMYMAEQGYLVYDEEADILYKKHNMILTEGIVEENRVSTLDGTQKSGKTSVKISGKSFYDPEGKLDAFLGQEVVVVTDREHENTILLAWTTQRNEEVVLPANILNSTADDIEAGRIVTIDKDGDTERYNLEKDFLVVKNDVADPYYSTEDLMLTNGQLRLLDNDSDGIYDVVFVEVYTLHYLKNGFFDASTLTIIDSDGLRQSFDLESVTITDSTGASAATKAVKADVVIKLFASNDGSRNRIVVYGEPISGKVTGLGDTEVSLDEKVYPLSLAYQNAVPTYEPIPGEVVSAFVDEAGEVLWLERDLEAIRDSWTLAFSRDIASGRGLDASLCLKLFTINGAWKEIYAADKVIVDGVSTSRDDLRQLIANDTDNRFLNEIVRFKQNSNGELSALDTLEPNAYSDGTLELTVEPEIAAMAGTWTSRSGAFWSGQSVISMGKEDTPVFVVPVIRNDDGTEEVAIGASYDDYYRVLKLNNVIVSHRSNEKALKPYMNDDFGYPTCFIATEPFAGTVTSSTFVTNEAAEYMLVDSVATSVNAEGEMIQVISGHSYIRNTFVKDTTIQVPLNLDVVEIGKLFQEQAECFGNSKMINSSAFLALAPEVRNNYICKVNNINTGDIIRYQKSGDMVDAIERMFDFVIGQPAVAGENPNAAVWYACGNNPTAYSIYYRHQIGTFKKIDAKAFSIETPYINPNTNELSIETYQSSVFTEKFTVDTTGAKPKLKAIQDLSQYEGADVQTMLYSYNGSPLYMIIYPYQ